MALYSCSKAYKYPSDKTISGSNGSLIDSIKTSYILDTIYFEGNEYTYQWDMDIQNKIDEVLTESGSPILFNYFLQRDIIRVVSLNDDNVFILDVTKKDQELWLTYKGLTEIKDSTMVDLGYTTNIRSISIDDEQWKIIDSLAQQVIFEDMKMTSRNINLLDTPAYFIEYHTKDKYFYCYSNNKDKALKEFITYLKTVGHFIKI